MIPLLDLVAQYQSIKPEIDAAIQEVLNSGKFILGPQEKAFEQEIAEYLGVKHAIGVASGTDALIIALRAAQVGPGDEVIVPAYSFFATAGAVLSVGATPAFVDIDPDYYLMDVTQLEAALTPNTKAIIPVHLYGQSADMDAIMGFAKEHNLVVIEDNAQAFGCVYKNQKTGSIGNLGCLSFFPSKNLGGYGDGGMVVTNDDEFAEKIHMLRTHGWKKKYFPELLGYNSRLDEIQASVLRIKLKYVDSWNSQRTDIAHYYNEHLCKLEVVIPNVRKNTTHVYHLYIIRVSNRKEFQEKLYNLGVSSEVYYPQPLHLAVPCRDLGWKVGDLKFSEIASRETLAIPLFPNMLDYQINVVLNAVRVSMIRR
ncbi:MAG: DegT/DnrJ/EryC1/StrS family aminotransferase [Anaerolineaceae bacterium]